MKRIQGIYRIVHIESGQFYIGRTVDWARRQKAHVWHLERGKHQNPKLQRAWDKYGAGAFHFEFLEEVTREELVAREQAYLDELQPFYNVALNAANPILGPVKTHCPAGHPYEGENRRVTRDGGIRCRACNATRQSARWRRLQQEAGREIGVYTRARTHCPQGHSYAEHAGILPSGWRYCKQCNRDRANSVFRAKRAAEGREIGPKTEDRTHCPRGHEYSSENTHVRKDGSRQCRVCKREKRAAEVEAKKQAGTYRPRGCGLQELNAKRTHCRHGHEFTPENTRFDRNGWRLCQECKRVRQQADRSPAAKALR